MVNFNANVSGIQNAMKDVWKENAITPKASPNSIEITKVGSSDDKGADFTNALKAVENYINNRMR